MGERHAQPLDLEIQRLVARAVLVDAHFHGDGRAGSPVDAPEDQGRVAAGRLGAQHVDGLAAVLLEQAGVIVGDVNLVKLEEFLELGLAGPPPMDAEDEFSHHGNIEILHQQPAQTLDPVGIGNIAWCQLRYDCRGQVLDESLGAVRRLGRGGGDQQNSQRRDGGKVADPDVENDRNRHGGTRFIPRGRISHPWRSFWDRARR